MKNKNKNNEVDVMNLNIDSKTFIKITKDIIYGTYKAYSFKDGNIVKIYKDIDPSTIEHKCGYDKLCEEWRNNNE